MVFYAQPSSAVISQRERTERKRQRKRHRRKEIEKKTERETDRQTETERERRGAVEDAYHFITDVCLTLRMRTVLQKTVFTGFSLKTQPRLLLLNSYILSQLDYCNCLLMGTPNSVIQPLQKIQNFAARLVLLAPRHHHATPLLEKLQSLVCVSVL